jgi:AraC-like DNA-binding protein
MSLNVPLEYGNDRRTTADVWWVLFNGREMPHMFTELRADHDPIFDRMDTSGIEALFRQLFDLIRYQPPAYEPKSAALLLTMIGELFASRAQAGDFVSLVGRTAVLSEPVRRSIDYITRFYAQPTPLKRICAAVDQNMYHFSRLFHREVGMPPIQYLNRFRIEQAKRLLAASNEPIAQVRLMVGIPSAVHFSRLFRKLTGVSPNEYRAKALRKQTKRCPERVITVDYSSRSKPRDVFLRRCTPASPIRGDHRDTLDWRCSRDGGTYSSSC